MNFRRSFGENMIDDSPFIRDSWQLSNVTQLERLGLDQYPKHLKSSGVERMLGRALWKQRTRSPLG
ncbi:MAG: hypothetical protein ACRD8Z_14805 [Nitrososphaeraceae archaeon]